MAKSSGNVPSYALGSQILRASSVHTSKMHTSYQLESVLDHGYKRDLGCCISSIDGQAEYIHLIGAIQPLYHDASSSWYKVLRSNTCC